MSAGAHEAPSATGRARALAWMVHLYTALGAPIGVAALAATVRHDPREAFLWMAAAIFIDATDGTLARAARVKEVVPEFDGTLLDNVVDYLNYTVVPVFFALHTGMLPPAIDAVVAASVLLSSAYGFAHTEAKTDDFFFTGFPSYWNIVVFYLFALEVSPAANAAVLLTCAILVFVPIAYLYPSRTPTLRPFTVAFGSAWAASLTWAIVTWPDASKGVLWASLAFPVYYVALSLALDVRRRRDRRSRSSGERSP